MIGTEDVRRGWRIGRARCACASGVRFITHGVERCSPSLAGAVTERIWACVSLQWDWLGGEPAADGEPRADAPREVSSAA